MFERCFGDMDFMMACEINELNEPTSLTGYGTYAGCLKSVKAGQNFKVTHSKLDVSTQWIVCEGLRHSGCQDVAYSKSQ